MIGRVLTWVAERHAKGKSYADLARQLQESESTVTQRMAKAADLARNREAARHIIGIERWGQRRLRSLLDEPLVIDEYDGYRPGDTTLPTLLDAFKATRAETLTLLRALEQAQLPLTRTVPHNDGGPMTIGAWIDYLASHASRESIRIR
jgi:hypothetical protein